MQEPAAALAFQSLSGRKAREGVYVFQRLIAMCCAHYRLLYYCRLRNLASGLSNAEWRILASELAQKTPKYDILGHLPAELVAAVCSRLCPVDVYSGRQVQRRSESPDL